MLAAALDAEVQDFLDRHQHLRDEAGRRQVIRNGRLPEREVLTGAGPLPIRQPRVRDKRGKDHPEAVSFSSAILPPYLRRSSGIDELTPGSTCAASAPATFNRPCRPCSGLKLPRSQPSSSAA